MKTNPRSSAGTTISQISGILLIISFLLLKTGSVQAQTQALTESDKREIKRQALLRISKDLPDKINNVTSDAITEADITYIIQNSYLPNSAGQQLFVNDEVIIEDDVDPTRIDPAGHVDKQVGQYLSDLVSFYPKNEDPIRPIFTVSVPRTIEPKPQSPTTATIDVFYSSAYKGNDKKGRSYQTVNRVATLLATKVGKKWEVYIQQIIFERRGAGLAQTTAPTVATVATTDAPPPLLEIREPTVVFRQEDYEFNATIRYNSKALDVVKSELPRLPLGQYRRRDDGAYELDGNRIVFEGKNKFMFTNRDRNLLIFSRVEPAKPRPDTTRALATKPAPTVVTPGYLPPDESQRQRKVKPAADTVKSAPALAIVTPKPAQETPRPAPETPKLAPKPQPEPPKTVAKTPVIEAPTRPENKPVNDPPKPTVAETKPIAIEQKPVSSDTKPAVAETKVVEAKPAPALAKAPEPKPPKPVVQKPAALSVSPALTKSLNNEQRRLVAGMRLRGWLQVVGGLAALGGSYVVYSGIKKDYDVYQAKASVLNANYTIFQSLSQRPVPPAPEPLSMTAYGAPAIYGVFGGGVVGIGLTVNGIRTLFRAGKVGKKK
ncbi:hypothetical protein [Fibrella aquatilis]|uniref:Uncharacterized protein n=1 Tax=Fibrella aquatilis TaxID=2817059 RepID=A0A939G9C7_9BACT|nr:hypothetical protein [Fibrella aquatilis]MBO0932466.1 hypothetical protein [Fibrella aquatilis]